MNCRVIGCANQAGGVGKSNVAVNLAAFLAQDFRVAVIDCDGQETSTMQLSVNPYQIEHSLQDALLNPKQYSWTDIVVKTEFNLDLIPASENLYTADLDLMNEWERESRLKKFLRPARRQYDFIIVDLPPSLGLMAVNCLNAVDDVLVICQAHPKSFNGLNMLLTTIERVRDSLNPDLKIIGVVLTLFEERTRVARQTLEKLRSHKELGQKILKTIIRKNTTLAEAGHREDIEAEHGIAVLGQPILYFDRKGSSPGYQDYESLAKEIAALTQ